MLWRLLIYAGHYVNSATIGNSVLPILMTLFLFYSQGTCKLEETEAGRN